MIKVKMGQTGISPASWPLYVAQAKGLLAEQGLEIENVVLASSVTQTQALVTGDMNFNTYSVDSMAKAIVAGAPLKYIAAAQSIPNFQLIVDNDIKSFADLKGKVLASGSAGGYFDIVMRAMLTANGLGKNDFQVISIGSSADRLPALQAKRISGMIAGGPDDSKALAAGFKSLGYVNDVLKEVEYNGYAVEDKWAKAHADQVVGFLRAMKKANDFLFNPANKAESIAIYSKISTLEPQYLETIYDQLINKAMLSKTLRPDPQGVENILKLAVDQGGLEKVPPLETWMDFSYLDKAVK
jgi:NitT/TauT family transport system substrate-binding protein